MAKKQTDTGKAFEYCFAMAYYEFLKGLKLNVDLIKDGNFDNAERSYNTFNPADQASYYKAAKSTIETIVKIEPGLSNQLSDDLYGSDVLTISIAPDAAGQTGDVRDVLFKRHNWQIGFSLKNNHDASKHSRLSASINFAKDWFDYNWSADYQAEVGAIFSTVKSAGMSTKWADYPQKEATVYVPVLLAFKKELERLNAAHKDIPQKLLSYLL